MADAAAPKFLSQADFARRREVSRKSVTTWKSKGLLVFSDAGDVDVDASEWNLDQRPPTYRGGVTHRPVRKVTGNKNRTQVTASANPDAMHGRQKIPAPADSPEMDPDLGAGADLDLAGSNLPMPEAVRRKENYLGLLRKRELEISNGEWVRVEDVGKTVEREYSVVRERLLAIPGKLAAKLVDRDRTAIELALFEEISEALSELHDPDSSGDPAGAVAAKAEEGQGIS